MKKAITALLCAALLLVAAVCPGLAESSAPDAFVPLPEDFAGEYTCSTIAFGENVVPLDAEAPYTLSITEEEAVFSGIAELGTEPLKLCFEDGEFYWIPPEEDVRVFTLRLQEDGLVTLTFDQIPEAPVFRFEPVPSEAESEG